MTKEEYREKNRAACAANYQKNREKRLAYQREYNKTHKEENSMKAKLYRMGLLQKRDKRGRPAKDEEGPSDVIRKMDATVYAQRLAECKAMDEQRRLRNMAEKLRQAGYTVIEKENEDE